MENRFSTGEIVVDRTRPGQKLLITRYANLLYYCQVEEGEGRKELVYREGDLKSHSPEKTRPPNADSIIPFV